MKNKAALVFAVVAGVGAFIFFWWGIGMNMVISLLLAAAVAALVWFVVGKLTEPGKGHWSAKETCAICGKEVGLNRFKIGKTLDGKNVWKCMACSKKGGYVKWDRATGKAELVTEQETEVRVKCNTCGHIYCYTAADLDRSIEHAKHAAFSSVLAAGNAIGGSRLSMHAYSAEADREMDKVKDFNKCPKCNSVDIRWLSKEEFAKEKAASSAIQTPVSSADELKKFKELLDTGVITQEEFDAQKKQLLSL